MKLLQNMAGNFLNLTPQEAEKFAAQLLKAAKDAQSNKRGSAGFVQTVVLTERNQRELAVLDTVFVGVDKNWLDVHPTVEPELKPRESHILNIDRAAVNVRLK